MSESVVPAEVRCFAGRADALYPIDRSEARDAIRRACSPEPGTTDGFVWIDLLHPGESEAAFLREELGMHPLAVEDCLRGRQRPKIDHYQGYSFIVFYASRINQARARMALNEVHLFLGKTFLITVHNQQIPEIDSVIALCRETNTRWGQAAAVAHAILDGVTDSYFPLIEHFSSRIEEFEEQVFLAQSDHPIERVAHLRRELIHFRRILGPERDVLSMIVRRDLPFAQPELIPYFQDVHDHILRATEELDTLRDLLAGLLEMHASAGARQLNKTMQTLTAWSIILMSMTLIAGIYGMNFAFMPELEWEWGYFGSLLLMLCVGLVIGGFFRRREWL